MKLLRLDLLRYGHLTDVGLDFPADAQLHVVLGANEAGKSTALAAIADGLFGFGHRTDYDFLHGGTQLRVGFTLQASDGTKTRFVRRKGRRDTLRDGGDEAVPDDTLRHFLGGASRELFERGFGLDGARLRAGGQELLRSGGDAGESLLAGTGLLHLRAALERLDEEAKTLVGDGRGRRRLSEAVDTWRQAHRAMEERAVAPRTWQDAEKSHAEAVAELARVQEQARELAAETSRLQRVRRVAQLLAELAAKRDALIPLAAVPQLPPDADARRNAATTAHAEATRDTAREATELQRLRDMAAALPRDAAVLAAQDAIDAISERRPVVLQAETDLPTVLAAIATHSATVASALMDLGVSQAPEVARDAIPPAGARQAVQRLIGRHAVLTAALSAAEANLTAVTRRRDQEAVALAAMPVPEPPELLRRTIESVRSEGPLDAELEKAHGGLRVAEQDAADALAALPLWHSDMAGLVACPLPLEATESMVAAQLEASARTLAKSHDEAANLARDIMADEADIARLAQGETVPTPDAVAAARVARDRVWRIIRRMHDGGATPEDVNQPTGSLPEVFEALRDNADRLADRRADEAQRVADYFTVVTRLAAQRGRQADLAAALTTAEAAHAQANDTWLALWTPSGLTPESPVAMAEWRRARLEVLRLAAASAEARRRHVEIATRHGRALADMRAVLPDTTEHSTLAALLRRAELACTAAEAAVTAHRARAEALAREAAHLQDCQTAVTKATADLTAWQHDWGSAIAALGLGAETPVEIAEAALAAWARIAEIALAWRTDDGRVTDMQASIAAFTHVVRTVEAHISHPPSDDPPLVVATRLARRLRDARKAEADAAALAARIAAHEANATDAAQRFQDAESELLALRAIAGAPDDAALARVIIQASQRDALAHDITDLEQKLRAQGDGLAEDTLRDEAAAADPDTTMARLAEIDTVTALLGERRETLSVKRTQAEAELARMRAGMDAAGKAQEAADALAGAHAAAERYARLHIARVLLRAGIERFRAEQQGPLLRAASGHFSLLTAGRYTRLRVDEDQTGHMVLRAIRDDGTECPVGALSEGARDQLYLALRVAVIQAHAEHSEPLPFIADDLLVHFDDDRAAAAITLLRQVGRISQVILFTHHAHISALAAGQEGVAIQRI